MQTYDGMIVGEHSRDSDLDVRKFYIFKKMIGFIYRYLFGFISDCRNHHQQVNPVRTKELTNIRAPGKDENVRLTPPRLVCLSQCVLHFFSQESIVG